MNSRLSNRHDWLPPGALGSRYQPLVVVLAALAAGIAADRWWPHDVRQWWSLVPAALAAWAILRRCGRDRAATVVLLVAVSALGAAWHHIHWHLYAADEIGRFALDPQPRTVCVEAVARGRPRTVPSDPYTPLRIIPAGDRSRLELVVTGIRDGRSFRPAAGRVVLTVDGHLSGIDVGDRLRIVGRLSRPRGVHNPGEFDRQAHLRADRQLAELRASHPEAVRLLATAARWDADAPWRLLEALRAQGRRLLREHLDERRWGLAAAVLLGAREDLDAEQIETFVETGTIHLLAISGLHVGILWAALAFVLVRCGLVPRRLGILLLAGLIVAYAALTDARPPVVRATILCLVASGAMWLYRQPLAFNTLAVAAIIVLVRNPADLFGVGTQLSFLAVAALGALGQPALLLPSADPLEVLVRRNWPMWRTALHALQCWVVWLLVTSLAVWLVAAPLVMARFHLVTPLAIPLHVLLYAPITLALLAGFLLLLAGWIVPPLAAPIGIVTDKSFAALHAVVDAAHRLPGSHFWVPGPDDWWLAVLYAALALAVAAPRWLPPRRWCVGLVVGWSAVAMTTAALRAERADQLECTFLSVGHGCCVVIELPDGRTMLYDAGHFGAPASGARSVAGYLWSRGIVRIDAIVLSHADADHYNMVPELLRRFDVGTIHVSPLMFRRQSAALEALRSAIAARHIPLGYLSQGARLAAGGARIDVMHPPPDGVPGSDNANSLVLAIEHRGTRMLLAGDLEGVGLDRITRQPPYDCDVLLAPHHGSPASSPRQFTTWCLPDWVVVSGALRDDLHVAVENYEAVGAAVLHTAQCGAIHAIVSEKGLAIELLGPSRRAPARRQND